MIQRTSSQPLRIESRGEDVEIVSPDGRTEVRVAFGPDGPVVTVKGARVRLEADDLELRCKSFAVETEGDIRLRAKGDVSVDGALVRLNCEDE